jgi:hypothetical protein
MKSNQRKKTAKKRVARDAPVTLLIHVSAITLICVIISIIAILTTKELTSSSVLGTSTTSADAISVSPSEQIGNYEGISPLPSNIPSGYPTPGVHKFNGNYRFHTQQFWSAHAGTNPSITPTYGLRFHDHGFSIFDKQSHGSLPATSSGRVEFLFHGERVKIGTNSAQGYGFSDRSMHIPSQLPVSFNSATGSLIVTTSKGTESVNLLPFEAITQLLQSKILSSVNQQASNSANTGIYLTQVNNQAAFAISGSLNKKLFGLIPVTINKTVNVSATNGQVVNTQESFLTKILDTLSF